MLDPVRWRSEHEEGIPGKLRLIDQTKLPEQLVYLEMDEAGKIYDAIRRLVVRGAPALGCTGALGLAAVCQHVEAENVSNFLEEVRKNADYLGSARPTAVNLVWALERCRNKLNETVEKTSATVYELKKTLLQEAQQIVEEDQSLCRSIGEKGYQLFEETSRRGVLTHCNAGALATSDYGTALSPIYVAQEKGLAPRVFADETRPLLQGSRLTVWELQQQSVDVTLICDNMAAQVMRESLIDFVLVGADRIAANGDTANKIGTYGLALAARSHDIPFYVAAPYSTIDMNLPSGDAIPIEQRSAEEIRQVAGKQVAPPDCKVYSPAFDVTPNTLIQGIVTEHGILYPPLEQSIASYMNTVMA